MRILRFVSAFFALPLIFSCGTASNASRGANSTFYESNIGDFSEEKLDNGIPVVLKRNSGSQVAVVRLVFDGGVPLVPFQKSGLEEITLDLMLHGSERYSFQKIQRLEYEMMFSMASASYRDFSTISMNCIYRDFNDVLDVFADSVLNPLFLEKEFRKEITLQSDSLHSALNSPEGVLSDSLSKVAFVGHPYRSAVSVNRDSDGRITLEDVKAQHGRLLNADRMKIVAVGNFSDGDRKEILERLNMHFGKVACAGFSRPEIPEIDISGARRVTVAECVQAGEIGYIEGIFPCPNRDSPDYVPYVLASMFIDDSLFKTVREKNGAVYSVGTGVVGARKFVGAISIFKATRTEGLGRLVTESLADFPKSEGEIAGRLDPYKNKYITAVFQNSKDAQGVAGNIVSSLIYRDSATEYLNRTSEIHAVTASDVMEAYRKYYLPLVEDPSRIKWIVVSGRETAGKFEM